MCRTGAVGGRKHPSCSPAGSLTGNKLLHFLKIRALKTQEMLTYSFCWLANTHIDARCGRVELVFGQGWRGWRGQAWRGALIEEDAAVGETVLPQVSAHA